MTITIQADQFFMLYKEEYAANLTISCWYWYFPGVERSLSKGVGFGVGCVVLQIDEQSSNDRKT